MGHHEAVKAGAISIVFQLKDVAVFYGTFRAVRDVHLDVAEHEITAFIGPSGCGKTTLLRCFNRMNDLIESARVEGTIHYHGVDLYDPAVSAVRSASGSAWCSRSRTRSPRRSTTTWRTVLAFSASRRSRSWTTSSSARSRRGTVGGGALRLKTSALGMSGGQQQQLCIARAIAVEPEVILMDEALLGIGSDHRHIEELMQEIKQQYTIVIVTHNMQQAARVSDRTRSSPPR